VLFHQEKKDLRVVVLEEKEKKTKQMATKSKAAIG
jgi:hypothetical protein